MISGPVPNFALSGSNKQKTKKHLLHMCGGQCNICRCVNVDDYCKLLLFPCSVLYISLPPVAVCLGRKEKSNDAVLQQSGATAGP